MDETDVSQWFDDYLEAFATCGRGESETRSILGYWAVPLLVATDDGFTALTSTDAVVATAQQQIDGMLAAGYDHTVILASDVDVMNARSAVYRGEFSRRRADGREIGRVTASYVVTHGSIGRRISALVVHGDRSRDPGRRASELSPSNPAR